VIFYVTYVNDLRYVKVEITSSRRDVPARFFPVTVRAYVRVKALAEHLASCRDVCAGVTSVLELGAGTGLVGLTAAMLAADPSRVVLTDNNERVLDLLQRNIRANFADTQRESVAAHRRSLKHRCSVTKKN